MKDLNGNEYNQGQAIKNFYNEYQDDFDSISDIKQLADSLNYMYSTKGTIDGFFLKSASDEYKYLCKALVMNI